MYVVFDTNNCL